MVDVAEDASDVEKLYKYGYQLHESNDKSQQVQVQAIRGLPLVSRNLPEYMPNTVDFLGQLLMAEGNVEPLAVHEALISFLSRDTNASLTTLYKHLETPDEPDVHESTRAENLNFVRDKVFLLVAELLKLQEQMERGIIDVVKKSLHDVKGAELEMFIDIMKSLSIFGEGTPPQRMQALIEIIEGQAALDTEFDVSDDCNIGLIISCLCKALPLFNRGASNSKFLNYLNKHIIPVFDKLPEKRKLDLLKNLAETAPYTSPQDSQQLLPSVVQLLKKYTPVRKTGEEMNFTCVECLLYTFHHLSHKTPSATNSLCGYKIVTGQPSDRLGEDFSENYKDFTKRLTNVEDLARTAMKKFTLGMGEHRKAMAAAKTEGDKADVKTKKQNTKTGLRSCNNILAMTLPLQAKSPSFDNKKINLSWKEAVKPSAPSTIVVPRGLPRPFDFKGTTVVAIVASGCIVVVADGLLAPCEKEKSDGLLTPSGKEKSDGLLTPTIIENAMKIAPVCNTMVAGMSGMHTVCQEVLSKLEILVRKNEKLHKARGRRKRLNVASVAAACCSCLRNKKLPIEQHASLLFAGYDQGLPCIAYADKGGWAEGIQDYFCMGSGGYFAWTLVKKRFQRNMQEDEALALGIHAVVHASQHEHTTGGKLCAFTVRMNGETSWGVWIKDVFHGGESNRKSVTYYRSKIEDGFFFPQFQHD